MTTQADDADSLHADSAGVPQLGTIKEHLERLQRPPSAVDKAEAAGAHLHFIDVPQSPECQGDLHIGVFFDGTGNNIKDDYGEQGKPKPFLARKHSNVARLYNIFPDEELDYRKDKPAHDKHQFRRIYVPGPGTAFPEISEEKPATMGGGAGAGGEPRILWAMIQVLNMVHEFYADTKLIPDLEADELANSLAYSKREEIRFFPNPFTYIKDRYNIVATDNGMRREAFEKLIKERLILPNHKPALRCIYIYPFGFSRGAAEARAFTNWMIEILENDPERTDKSPLPSIKGRSVFFPFLGIYDTVASVGLASLVSIFEGHSTWANYTQQIHPCVKKCYHLVAGHEFRATFPLDSVRVNGKYPGNCEEIVYPGSHSDVGGGYPLQSLGKDDLDLACRNKPLSSGDLQLSRVVGFDMYTRAREHFVPFYSIEQLIAQGREELAKDLLPDQRAIAAMEGYLYLAGVGALPVEEQLGQHAALYLHWRWTQGFEYAEAPFGDDCVWHGQSLEDIRACRPPRGTEAQRIGASISQDKSAEIEAKKKEIADLEYHINDVFQIKPTPDSVIGKKRIRLKEELAILEAQHVPRTLGAADNLERLRKTQKGLMLVISGYCEEIERRMSAEIMSWRPLENPRGLWYKTKVAAVEKGMDTIVNYIMMKGAGKYEKMAKKVSYGYKAEKFFLDKKKEELAEESTYREHCRRAATVLEWLKKWRAWIEEKSVGVEHDADAPDREGMWLLEALETCDKRPERIKQAIGQYFTNQVRDSSAGFVVPEFTLNGYGIAKFRRIYFGNDADWFTRAKVEAANEVRREGKTYTRDHQFGTDDETRYKFDAVGGLDSKKPAKPAEKPVRDGENFDTFRRT